jgi:hypothetical protein
LQFGGTVGIRLAGRRKSMKGKEIGLPFAYTPAGIMELADK